MKTVGLGPTELAMKADLQKRYPLGTKVKVLTAYQGSGRFAPDGFEGIWFVVGHHLRDLELARHAGDPWEAICHTQRIDGDPAAWWHPDAKNFRKE